MLRPSSLPDEKDDRETTPSGPPMGDVLLTKFYLPPPRRELVPRPRLYDRLAAGLAGSLTVISAPAGFGKTTLISGWAASPTGAGVRLAWLALDADDDDPARFLHYVAAALDTLEPGVGAEAAALLRAPHPPPLKAVTATLLNRLVNVSQPLALVLDDYHRLTDPRIHELVTFLVEHQPPPMRLVLLTRADPPLPLGRLRARGQLVELRAADLRFTEAETAQFLNEVMRLDLSDAEVAALFERTEGWIAGLQLAALSLAGGADSGQFIAAFTGSNRFVVEYLVEEVVERQPQATQDFLLATSILDRLCGPLCDAVLEKDEGGRMKDELDSSADASSFILHPSAFMLERLEHANLFLVPLDDERYWYRYHHLFQDFLRARLNKTQPDRAAALHRRASVWHAAQGFIPEAVKHAFQTRDWDYAASLVERHGAALIGRSQMGLLRDWLAAFPEDVIRARPALCIFDAWPRAMAFRSDYQLVIEERLRQAEQAVAGLAPDAEAPLAPGGPPVSFRAWVAGHAATLRSQLLLLPNIPVDAPELIALSRQALELLPASDRLPRSVNAINLAHAHMSQSDISAAETALAAALRLALEAGNYYTATTVGFYQARLAFWQGRLAQAAEICQQRKTMFSQLVEQPARDLPALRSLDVPLALVQLERNDLAGAEQSLARALDLFGWAPWIELIGYTALARLREIQRDPSGALDAVDRLARLGPDLGPCAEAQRVAQQVRTGEPGALAQARAWAEAHRLDWNAERGIPGVGPFQCDLDYITAFAWAQVQIGVGQPALGLAFVEPVLADAVGRGLAHRVIELSLAEAQARRALGEHRRAWEALDQALALAEPAGYARTFDQGPALTRLLVQAAQRGVHRDYVEHVLAHVAPRSLAPTHNGVEHLSERELEVLRLIAAGLSNAEIAARLFVEVSTVKRHVHHIFGKLGVATRTQALARGRALGLLD